MKTNTTTWILAIMACAALAVVTGCADATGSSGGTGNPSGTDDPGYIGQFTNTANSNDEVIFEVGSSTSASASIRAAGDSASLTGKLKDKSGIYKLSGTYDPDSGIFILSVNGKDFRYIISGAQKDGSVYAVNAQVYKKANNPNGDMVICPVSEHTGGRITGNATGQSDDRTNALPNTFDGRWQNVSTNQNGMEVFDTIWLSPYSFNFQGIEQLDQGAGGKITMKMQEFAILPLEVTRKNDVSYDIIVANRTVDSWLSTDQKNAVAQLFADYLTEKGITATRVSDEQSSSGFSSNTTSKEYSIHGNGNIYCNNFSVDFDWFRHISEWRNDNIQPRYIKCNLAIVNGNKLNLSFYLNGNNAESYLTLQEAKNSTTATPYKQFTRK